jgi:hypothetical protein
MSLPTLTPSHRLDELVPAGAVYAARPWPGANPWFPTDRHAHDAPTGNMLPFGGSMSCLVHRAVVGPESLALYEMAGITDLAPTIPYEPPDEPVDLALRLAESGRALLSDHTPPRAYWDRGLWVNAPSLIAHLNNKANLQALAPPHGCPERFFVPAEELERLGERLPALPVVLKAATEHGNGAGFDVRICRTLGEWRDGVTLFRNEAAFLQGVVVERFETFRATWCAIVGIGADGWSYWGSAQQVCGEDGKYGGNWKGQGFELPEEALDLVAHVAEQGRERGFRGVAGMDIGENETGRMLVFDLNFRLNGCTPQVVLHAAACERTGARVSRIRRFRFRHPLADVIADVRPLVEQGTLIPISAFDSELDPEGAGLSSIAAILVGADYDDVHRLEEELAARA